MDDSSTFLTQKSVLKPSIDGTVKQKIDDYKGRLAFTEYIGGINVQKITRRLEINTVWPKQRYDTMFPLLKIDDRGQG